MRSGITIKDNELGSLFINSPTYVPSTNERILQTAKDMLSRGECKKSMAIFKDLSKKGDPVATYYMGLLFTEGNGVPKSFGKAKKYFEKAAELGVANAYEILGRFHEEGLGVPRNHEKAFAFFKLAVDKGDLMASHMGTMLLYGLGIQKDAVKAKEIFELGAKANMAPAVFKLGMLFHEGAQDVPRDFGKARIWYERAIDLHVIEAYRLLGTLYLNGQGVEADPDRAMACFEQGAAERDPDAFHQIALLHMDENGKYHDMSKAIRNLEMSARLGSAEGTCDLGILLVENEERQDVKEGVELLRRAVEMGSSRACLKLAEFLREGKHLEQNYDYAIELLRFAQRLGSARACRELGQMYEKGLGVPQDPSAARDLYLEADRREQILHKDGPTGTSVS